MSPVALFGRLAYYVITLVTTKVFRAYLTLKGIMAST
jgi:hypothetical protein